MYIYLVLVPALIENEQLCSNGGHLARSYTYVSASSYWVLVPVLIKMNNNCAQKEVIVRKGRLPVLDIGIIIFGTGTSFENSERQLCLNGVHEARQEM
jgi:hypothetical protein